MKKSLLIVVAAALMSGCTIPRAAFKSSLMSQDSPQYHLVDVTSALTVKDAEVIPETRLDGVFLTPDWPWAQLTQGDRLHITVLSSGGAEYLSGPSNGDRVDFEDILVTGAQTVVVPYAGTIPVQGLDMTQLADEITRRLSRVVLNPQVLVTLSARTGAMVTVQGGGGKTGRFPVDSHINRLSHVLAMAITDNTGGEMTDISVTRQQQTFRVRLADIERYPERDIALQPDDRVTIRPVTAFVTVLGAAGVQGKHPLVARHASVIDALALAKGMDDALADPQAVFLFKHHESERAKQHMRKPNIYHVDMSQPDAVFRARTLMVDDGDVLYISNASLTDFAKVSAAFGAFISGGQRAL